MLLWRSGRLRAQEADKTRARLRSSVAGPGNLTLAAAASATGSPARRQQIIAASVFSGVISKEEEPPEGRSRDVALGGFPDWRRRLGTPGTLAPPSRSGAAARCERHQAGQAPTGSKSSGAASGRRCSKSSRTSRRRWTVRASPGVVYASDSRSISAP